MPATTTGGKKKKIRKYKLMALPHKQLHLKQHANRIKIENGLVLDLAGFGFWLDSVI